MKRDEAAVVDILRAARLACSFVAETDRTAFETDEKTQSAVLHQLLVIGEAAKRTSDKLRAEHPEVPWRLMAGMRDKIVHEYDAVDVEEVWNTLNRDLPELIRLLESVEPSPPA
jgi:uncharacterized protein with HEPN domain